MTRNGQKPLTDNTTVHFLILSQSTSTMTKPANPVRHLGVIVGKMPRPLPKYTHLELKKQFCCKLWPTEHLLDSFSLSLKFKKLHPLHFQSDSEYFLTYVQDPLSGGGLIWCNV